MRYIGLEKKRASRERGRYNYRVPGNYSSVTRVGAAAGVGMCRERERESKTGERKERNFGFLCLSPRADGLRERFYYSWYFIRPVYIVRGTRREKGEQRAYVKCLARACAFDVCNLLLSYRANLLVIF